MCVLSGLYLISASTQMYIQLYTLMLLTELISTKMTKETPQLCSRTYFQAFCHIPL